MKPVPLNHLFENDPLGAEIEGFIFHQPQMTTEATVSFSELPEEMHEHLKPFKEQMVNLITLENQGYAGQAQMACQNGRRVLTAKEIMEQRVKYRNNKNVVNFLWELQERRYTHSPLLQRDYQTMIDDPELRWFVGLGTITAVIREDQQFMIIPHSSTLEEIAQKHLNVQDNIVKREVYSQFEKAGYLFRPNDSFTLKDYAEPYLALADGDQQLVKEYHQVMAIIKFGCPSAQKEWDQSKKSGIGFLQSADTEHYSRGLWNEPNGLAPVILK